MRPGLRRTMVMLAAALTWGCGPKALTPAEQRMVDRYLICVECVEPLDSVRALATRRPVATVDSLNSALVHGLAPAAIALADSLLRLGYARDSTWRVAHGRALLSSSVVYVAQARARYAEGYRARGAVGMGWIHDARAVRYLDAAMSLRLPASVSQAVIFARDSLPPP